MGELAEAFKDLKVAAKARNDKVRIEKMKKRRWKYLDIRFKDGETILVKYNGVKLGYFSFEKMGFLNKKTRRPNNYWTALRDCIAINNGALRADDLEAARILTPIRKIASELRKSLRSAFRIHEDPFVEWGKIKDYQVKFRIKGD